MPYLAGRFGIIDEMRVIPGAEGRATAAETFRRLYWNTATSWESTPSYSAPGENFAVSEIESGQEARNELAAAAWRSRVASRFGSRSSTTALP